MTDENNVRPLRPIRPELPQSAVMPIARKISGTMAANPRELVARRIERLVASATDCLVDAGAARDEGDDAGSEVLVAAAHKAMSVAYEIFEMLAE